MSSVHEFHGNKEGLRHWAWKFITQSPQRMFFLQVFLLFCLFVNITLWFLMYYKERKEGLSVPIFKDEHKNRCQQKRIDFCYLNSQTYSTLVALLPFNDHWCLLRKPQNDATLFSPSALLVTSSGSDFSMFPLCFHYRLLTCLPVTGFFLFCAFLHPALSPELFSQNPNVLKLLISP